jgi:RNA polymerase sigma-70 factor (ECF subfamily)
LVPASDVILSKVATLTERLRALWPALAGDDAAMEEILQSGLADARSRWPEVHLDDDPFLAHLARLLAAGAGELAALELPDLFLACACLAQDRAALTALESEVLGQVPLWIRRIAGGATDDIQQDLRQKLLVGPEPLLAGFQGRKTLAVWVRVIASRRAIDHQRLQKPQQDPGELEDLWSGPDPELDAIKLHDAQALRDLLHQALEALPPRERNLLRLHYLEGVSLDRLAVLERVHRATVARWLAASRDQVLDRVRDGLSRTLRLTESESESLLRLVRSRIEISLRRVLAGDPPPSP